MTRFLAAEIYGWLVRPLQCWWYGHQDTAVDWGDGRTEQICTRCYRRGGGRTR